MNYLAHTALAQPNLHSLVGNLLGDFCKGVDLQAQPKAILDGLANHRAVDKFTDQHSELRQHRLTFSPQRRRFAGIALDVLFDHLLIKHWPRFYHTSFVSYKQQLYRDLATAEHLMPEQMRITMRQVRQQDWLASYQHLPTVGHALDNIAKRLRFANAFSGMINEIMPRYDKLERTFLEFYPQLQQHVSSIELEALR